jgi:hypothetical protein
MPRAASGLCRRARRPTTLKPSPSVLLPSCFGVLDRRVDLLRQDRRSCVPSSGARRRRDIHQVDEVADRRTLNARDNRRDPAPRCERPEVVTEGRRSARRRATRASVAADLARFLTTQGKPQDGPISAAEARPARAFVTRKTCNKISCGCAQAEAFSKPRKHTRCDANGNKNAKREALRCSEPPISRLVCDPAVTCYAPRRATRWGCQASLHEPSRRTGDGRGTRIVDEADAIRAERARRSPGEEVRDELRARRERRDAARRAPPPRRKRVPVVEERRGLRRRGP